MCNPYDLYRNPGIVQVRLRRVLAPAEVQAYGANNARFTREGYRVGWETLPGLTQKVCVNRACYFIMCLRAAHHLIYVLHDVQYLMARASGRGGRNI